MHALTSTAERFSETSCRHSDLRRWLFPASALGVGTTHVPGGQAVTNFDAVRLSPVFLARAARAAATLQPLHVFQSLVRTSLATPLFDANALRVHQCGRTAQSCYIMVSSFPDAAVSSNAGANGNGISRFSQGPNGTYVAAGQGQGANSTRMFTRTLPLRKRVRSLVLRILQSRKLFAATIALAMTLSGALLFWGAKVATSFSIIGSNLFRGSGAGMHLAEDIAPAQWAITIVVEDASTLPSSRLSAITKSLLISELNSNEGAEDTHDTALRVLAANIEHSRLLKSVRWPIGPTSLVDCGARCSLDVIAKVVGASPGFVVFADTVGDVSPNLSAYFRDMVLRVDDSAGPGLTSADGAFGAPIFAIAADAIAVPDAANRDSHLAGTVVQLDAMFPATGVLSITSEAWNLFVQWRRLQEANNGPFPPPPKGVRTFSGDSESGAPKSSSGGIRDWFALFVEQYGGRVLYPTFDSSSQGLLVRPAPTAQAGARGGRRNYATDVSQRIRLYTPLDGDDCRNLAKRSGDVPAMTQGQLPAFSLHTGGGLPPRFRGVPIEWNDKETIRSMSPNTMLLEPNADKGSENKTADEAARTAHSDAVAQIAQFRVSRGTEWVAFTLVTASFVETTYSWVCNALAVNALPPALVFGAADRDVVTALNKLFAVDERIDKTSILSVDLSSAISATQKVASRDAGIDFGSTEYWLLMLERTALLRDLLDAGVGVLHFETDQIWFENPSPYIDQAESEAQGPVDMVVTINTRNEVSGNFFHIFPTLRSRHIWAMVTQRFEHSYQQSLKSKEAKQGKWHYIENDQSLLTKYVLGKERWYDSNFPPVSYAVLDMQRFVDGTWYLDFEDEKGNAVPSRSHYTSENSLHPVVLNNNFMIGVDAKKARAQRFQHWFWNNETGACNRTRGSGRDQLPVVAIA